MTLHSLFKFRWSLSKKVLLNKGRRITLFKVRWSLPKKVIVEEKLEDYTVFIAIIIYSYFVDK